MPVTVGVNFLSVVHAGSNGITIAFPDVCKTPSPPAPPIPIPYPNIAKSSDTAQGATKVKCDGNPVCVKDSNFSMSTGDEAGSRRRRRVEQDQGQGGVRDLLVRREVRGQERAARLDMMLHNDKNTPPFPVMQGPAMAMGDDKGTCYFCGDPL